MAISLKITKLEYAEDLDLPAYATAQSAGMDLCSAVTKSTTIKPNEIVVIPTGIAIALPIGFEAQIRPRSGLAAKFGITVLNTPGTIDADYRGEIKVILINHGTNDFVVERGMRIAQMIIAKYEHVILEEVQSLDDTARGTKGFGSTGH
jgi:dUTP pyrophosphatase